MGFDPVILVGCPLTAGPYANHGNLGGLMGNENVVEDMKYATVTLVSPLPDGVNSIPREWFDAVPESAYYAAAIVESPDDICNAVDTNAVATKRKLRLEGWAAG